MNLEPNWKFSRDWLIIGRGYNSRENDGSVFSRHVDLLEDMGKLANNSLYEVEIGRAQSRPSIKDTLEVGAILFLMRHPRLKGDVSHGAMNCNRDRWQQG